MRMNHEDQCDVHVVYGWLVYTHERASARLRPTPVHKYPYVVQLGASEVSFRSQTE